MSGADDGSRDSPYNQWREKADDCRKALAWMRGKGLGPEDLLAAAIAPALRDIYDAGHLLKEMQGR